MMVGPYPRSPDKIDGGVAAAVMYLSQSLARLQGVELVSVRIARDPDDACEVGRFDWPVVDLHLGRLGLSTLYVRQKRQFDQLVGRYRPDVVHGQESDIAGYLAVGSGLPTVVTVHGILGACARLQSDFVTRSRAMLAAGLTERSTIRRAADLIAISSYITRYYANDIRGRVHHIPNAVASSFFGIRRSPERGRLLYAGRISNGKGLIELVRAFSKALTPSSRLVLAGAAPDAGYQRFVRAEVESLGMGDRVVFAGLLDEGALHREFAAAEALILPSFQETAPMVIQEAMAAGLAVIATDVGGIPDQVEEGVTGLLCRPGDVDGLARAILAVGSDPRVTEAFGSVARHRARERYQASAVAEATLRVYQGAVAAGAGVTGKRSGGGR